MARIKWQQYDDLDEDLGVGWVESFRPKRTFSEYDSNIINGKKKRKTNFKK
jgi:hypothetical protein